MFLVESEKIEIGLKLEEETNLALISGMWPIAINKILTTPSHASYQVSNGRLCPSLEEAWHQALEYFLVGLDELILQSVSYSRRVQ